MFSSLSVLQLLQVPFLYSRIQSLVDRLQKLALYNGSHRFLASPNTSSTVLSLEYKNRLGKYALMMGRRSQTTASITRLCFKVYRSNGSFV